MVDGETLTMQSYIRVRDGATYVDKISELEFANGYLYANVGHSDLILKINPSNGSVVKKWDISTLK